MGACVFVWLLACHSTARKSEDSFLGFFHQEGPRNETQVIWFVQQAPLPTESPFWLRRINLMGAKRSSCKSRSLVCQILVLWIPLIMYYGNKQGHPSLEAIYCYFSPSELLEQVVDWLAYKHISDIPS